MSSRRQIDYSSAILDSDSGHLGMWSEINYLLVISNPLLGGSFSFSDNRR